MSSADEGMDRRTLLTASAFVALAPGASPAAAADDAFVAPLASNWPISDPATELLRLASEAAVMRLPHLYAQAMDRGDADALAELFTRDAQFVGSREGVMDFARIIKIPVDLKRRYQSTYHAICNQTVMVDGTKATGEVYCIAHHVRPEADGRLMSNDVRIRYQDRYRLGPDKRWRFSFRRVVPIARLHLPVDADPRTNAA